MGDADPDASGAPGLRKGDVEVFEAPECFGIGGLAIVCERRSLTAREPFAGGTISTGRQLCCTTSREAQGGGGTISTGRGSAA